MKLRLFLACTLIFVFQSQSYATLIGGQDIISAPAYALDDFPGATNFHQQAFDEVQSYTLTTDLAVDGGIISAGTMVDSHMIFLNTPVGQGGATDTGVDWLFDGTVLGVMSDSNGTLEAASSAFLGAVGTVYPSAFAARGMEGADSYSVAGNVITVNMYVTEPGDWIRVITASVVDVPEPPVVLLLSTGLLLLISSRRKANK
jgi:hypothetical protein